MRAVRQLVGPILCLTLTLVGAPTVSSVAAQVGRRTNAFTSDQTLFSALLGSPEQLVTFNGFTASQTSVPAAGLPVAPGVVLTTGGGTALVLNQPYNLGGLSTTVCSNGRIDPSQAPGAGGSPTGGAFIGTFGQTTLRFTFANLIAGAGAILNYVPTCLSGGATPLIRFYGDAGNLLGQYNIDLLAAIVTPAAINQGGFRGFLRESADVRAVEFVGTNLTLDDLRAGGVTGGATVVPEPRSLLLLATGGVILGVITARRRQRGSRPVPTHGLRPSHVLRALTLLVLSVASMTPLAAQSVGRTGGTTVSPAALETRGVLRVIRTGVEGHGVAAAPLPPLDTMPTRRMGAACGPARLCAAVLNLRVGRVTHADTVAGSGLLRTTVTIENASRLPSTASELVLCVSATSCRQSPSAIRVGIPPLRSAEQFTVTRDLRAPAGADAAGRTVVTAMIDPERLTGETITADNNAWKDVRVELPDLVISTLTPAPETQGMLAEKAPLMIDVRVTNRSQLVSAPATEIELRSNHSGSHGNVMYCGNWGDAESRLPIPALAPGQAWTARVVVSVAAVSCKAADYQVMAWLDPDQRETWSDAMRSQVLRPYTVR